jgi:hypothetical protein
VVEEVDADDFAGLLYAAGAAGRGYMAMGLRNFRAVVTTYLIWPPRQIKSWSISGSPHWKVSRRSSSALSLWTCFPSRDWVTCAR